MSKRDITYGLYKFLKESVSEDEIIKAGTYKQEPLPIIEEEVIEKKKEEDTELEAAKKRVNKEEEDKKNKKATEAKTEEGKIPKDPSHVTDKTQQELKEQDVKPEIVIGEFSDENVAKELAATKKGTVVQDSVTKKWKVIVKEAKEDKEKEDLGVKAKSELKSILRKIHKAETEIEVEDQLDRLAKAVIKYDGSKEKFDIIKDEAARKKEKIKSGNKEPEPEIKTEEAEEEIDDLVESIVKEGKIDQLKEDIEATIKAEDKEIKIVAGADGAIKTTVTEKPKEEEIR